MTIDLSVQLIYICATIYETIEPRNHGMADESATVQKILESSTESSRFSQNFFINVDVITTT